MIKKLLHTFLKLRLLPLLLPFLAATSASTWELGNNKLELSIEDKRFVLSLSQYFCELKSGEFYQKEVLSYDALSGFVPCFFNQMSPATLYEYVDALGPLPVGRINYRRFANDNQVNDQVIQSLISGMSQNHLSPWDGSLNQLVNENTQFEINKDAVSVTAAIGSKLESNPALVNVFIRKTFYVKGIMIDLDLTVTSGMGFDEEHVLFIINALAGSNLFPSH